MTSHLACRSPSHTRPPAPHADEIPDPTDTVYRTCTEHRTAAGLQPRTGAPGQWYWCHSCHSEWQEDGTAYDPTRPGTGDILFMAVWLTYMVGLLFALMFGAALWLRDTGLSENAAIGWSLPISSAAWLIAIPISVWLRSEACYWSWRAWWYVWGAPLRASSRPNT